MIPARVQAALARVAVEQSRLRAVVVLPSVDRDRSLAACAEHAASRGYRLAAVASDVRAALGMVLDGLADVLIAGRGGDLLPVVEIASQSRARSGPDTPATRRRPRMVTR